MAKSTGRKIEFRVKWTTELPYEGVPCESPNICIGQDSAWYLRLLLSWNTYYLRLRHKECKDLQKPITVRTFVADCTNNEDPLLIEFRTVSESDACLWTQDKNELEYNIRHFRNAREISFICAFDPLESDMEIMSEKTQVSTQTDFVYQDLEHLSRDFSSLMKDETLSDVKLKCGDSTFSAHKSVLASRSEVFAAMFRNKMAESETGVVDVQDLEPEVLEQLLKYMYSGKKPNSWQDTARCLYEAADKYAVYDLKKACSGYMVASLTPENCLEMLVLADQHTDEDFKEAVSFFVARCLPLLKREAWPMFKTDHSELAIAVLEKRCAVLSGET